MKSRYSTTRSKNTFLKQKKVIVSFVYLSSYKDWKPGFTKSIGQWCESASGFESVESWLRIRVLADPGVFMIKNWEKIIGGKIFSGSKTTFYLSIGLHKGRPSHKRSLQLSKENIQLFKTWNFLIFFYFCGSFLPSWIRIRNPA
jgi:hypothetical protein